MPNVADFPLAITATLPHAVPLPGLSYYVLGRRFGRAFEACRQAAQDIAGEDWAASAIHEPGLGTSYVFRFTSAMASLHFSARAALALAASSTRPVFEDVD